MYVYIRQISSTGAVNNIKVISHTHFLKRFLKREITDIVPHCISAQRRKPSHQEELSYVVLGSKIKCGSF